MPGSETCDAPGCHKTATRRVVDARGYELAVACNDDVWRFESRTYAIGDLAAFEKAAPPDAARTPWQVDRNNAELLGQWPKSWGPYHRHFASDAIHRDGGPECGQPGTPQRVYVFDPDYLDTHERHIAKYAAQHPEQFTEGKTT